MTDNSDNDVEFPGNGFKQVVNLGKASDPRTANEHWSGPRHKTWNGVDSGDFYH